MLLFSCSAEMDIKKLQGETMGTVYHITMVNPPYDINAIDLQQDIDIELAGLDAIFSTYKDNSELSKINRSPVGQWQTLSPELFFVIQLAQTISESSSGAFDITVSPLVEFWGFGKTVVEHLQVPSQQTIASIQAQVGYQNIELDDSAQRLRKTKPLQIDLSAIAKGYAVDQVARLLNERRIENYLVEIGGEVKTRGVNPEEKPWRLGIEKPQVSLKQEASIALQLTRNAVATSGDYHNFTVIEDQTFSHTIDPRTGFPIQHQLASVTVVHDSVVLADAWATALNVLGYEQGLALAQQLNIAALFIQKAPTGELEVNYTPQFMPYLSEL